MEPPLKSRARGLGHLLQLARSGGSLSAPNRCAPLIEHGRARPNGDMPSGGAPTRFRADRENGSRLHHVLSLPVAGSGLCRRKARARSLRSPGGVCHSTLPLSALPVTGDWRRFPTTSGFGRFPPFAGERKTLTNP